MPTYQYACTACGEQHEAVQAFSDAPLTECPACGGTLRKVFSAVGVVFKGSGFYKTDSRASASKSETAPAAKNESGSKGESGGKAESGSRSDSGSKSDSGSSSTKSDGAAAKPASPPAAKTA